jgi:hypothetical protein
MKNQHSTITAEEQIRFNNEQELLSKQGWVNCSLKDFEIINRLPENDVPTAVQLGAILCAAANPDSLNTYLRNKARYLKLTVDQLKLKYGIYE